MLPRGGGRIGGTTTARRDIMMALGIVLSAVVGLALGVLGGGGSILAMTILVYVMGLPTHEAVTTSLLVVGATSAVALVPHARAGRVRWRTGVVFGLAGITGAFAAGRVAHFIPAGVLLALFGTVMLVTSVAMFRGRPVDGDLTAQPPPLPLTKVIAQGLGVGALTGLVGAGGGFLVVPALMLLGGLPVNVAVGTSLLVIVMNSVGGILGHLENTPVDFRLAAEVTAAAVVGTITGTAWARRISPDSLRRGFAWLVAAMAIFILGQQLPELLHVWTARQALPWALGAALLTLGSGLGWTALRTPPASAT